MVDPATARKLAGWALYIALAAVLVAARLMPMSTGALSFPGPDLVLALTLAWVLRRPDQVPVLLIALVALAEDVLLMGAPGLGAALMVLGTEFVRARESSWRDLPFLAEWALVGIVMAGMMLAGRAVMAVTFNAQPALGQSVLQLLATLAAYPLIVVAGRTILGMRRAATGEVDQYGRRR